MEIRGRVLFLGCFECPSNYCFSTSREITVFSHKNNYSLFFPVTQQNGALSREGASIRGRSILLAQEVIMQVEEPLAQVEVLLPIMEGAFNNGVSFYLRTGCYPYISNDCHKV